jgi:thiopurine S-methyltransferase
MDEAWLERWQQGHTGWHESAGNRNLKKYWRAKGKRVLVPMCGKTPDMLWLEEQGNEVVGVELSEIAVRAFFDEHGLKYERSNGALVEYRAMERRITLHCGDYFKFRHDGFDAQYDRGALVALPANTRPRYAQHTSSLLTNNAEQLVITLEYDQAVCDGPPFSISALEIQNYWPRLNRVAAIDDIEDAPPKFLKAGLDVMQEVVWRTS